MKPYTHIVRSKDLRGLTRTKKFTSVEAAVSYQKKLQASGLHRQVIVMPVPRESGEVRA
jgi:hypothetical protein